MNLSRDKLLFSTAWLGAIFLGALVYLPGLPGAFVFDDISNIVSNPGIKLQVLSAHGLLQAMLSAPVGGLLRPISTLSFVLDGYFFGIDAEAFKITNICIHVTVGILLWYLARELLRAYRATSGKSLDDRSIAWLSLTVSSLWLVHPLNLTSVLYAVQRDSSLAALFTAAAILSYMVGRRKPGPGGRVLIWLLTPLCMVLGMLCKENAALTPVFILVIEFTLLGFRRPDGSKSLEVRGFLLTFLLLPLLAAVGFAALRPGFFFSSYDGRGFTMYERLLSESRVLMGYLRWSFIPDLRQLGLFHDDIAPSHGLLDPLTTLPCLLAIAALVAAGVALRKKLPLLSFGILWFFAGQLMESTVLPLELAYEHRNYLPLFGLILGAVGTIYPLAAAQGRANLAKALLAVCVLLLALTTAMRAADWQTELTFARSESRHHPGSARALAELEWAYLNYVVGTKDIRVIPLVLDAAEKSKAADPGGISQDIAVAYMYASLGDLPEEKVHIRAAADTVNIAVPSATQQLALQTLLQMTGADNETLFPDMSLIFQRAVRNPVLMSNVCYAAGIWNTYGVFQRKIGEVPGALSAMHKATTLCPWNLLLSTNYIAVLLAYGDTRDAGPQLDALKGVHDLRYLPEIYWLQQEYAEELAAQVKK
jgi:hypothetical protein